jgi:hypothetical protein
VLEHVLRFKNRGFKTSGHRKGLGKTCNREHGGTSKENITSIFRIKSKNSMKQAHGDDMVFLSGCVQYVKCKQLKKYYIIIFIINCNWAYAPWQCYINNEQYVSTTEYSMHNIYTACKECKNITT